MKFLALLLIPVLCFGDVKISDLPLGSAAATGVNDSFPYVDAASVTTKRLKLSDALNIPTLASVLSSKQAVIVPGNFSTATTGVAIVNGNNSTFGPNVTLNVQTASDSQPGLLSAADHIAFGAKASAGSYITNLTSDVTANGPGSVAATVNSVGGSSASAVHSAELLANAATAANTASTILKRDGSGQVASTTFTGALVGNASSSTALASDPTDCGSNNYAISIDASGNLTCSTVSDSGLATSYIKSDGSRSLSSNWNAGAHSITATTFIGALTGNSSTSTALASDPTDCSANNYATSIDASGNLTCGTVSDSGLSTSYIKADGSRSLSADWNAGAHSITATTFIGALSGTATNATNVATTGVSTNASFYPLFVASSSNSNQAPDLSSSFTFNPSTGTLTATTFAGNATSATTATTATSATTATTATNATNVATTSVSTNATFYPLFVGSSSNGNQAPDLGTGLTFNPSTNTLTTTTFSGNATTATTATTATNATNAATVSVSNNASYFPLMVASSSNSNQAHNLGTGLTFNPSTNVLSTTTFSGALTGTASGNTTYTPNNHGVVVSSATNAMTVIAPGASTASVLYAGTSSADPQWTATGTNGQILQINTGIPTWVANSSTPSATAWNGYFDSTCAWSVTASSQTQPSVDTSCTLVELKNNNMGTVNPHNDGTSGHNFPGIVLNPASTGTYAVTATLNIAQSGSGNFAAAALTADGGSTFFGSTSFRAAAANQSMTLTVTGFITISSSTNLDFYLAASAGTTTVDQETSAHPKPIIWSVFRIY